MNKITLILFLLFVCLGFGAWWYSQNGTTKNTLSNLDDWYLAIDDISKVNKVFFVDRNGKSVTIVKEGNHWNYNNKYIARPNAVDLVLDVVKRVRLKYRPPAAAIGNAVKYLASNGIKVEVYDQNDQALKTFYVGGTTPDERGTYMMLEGSNNPYVFEIPAWEGSIRSRFFFGDEKWRDKTILAAKAENIQQISVEYPERKADSFVLTRNGDSFEVKPFGSKTSNKIADENRIQDYLSGFKSLGAEGFENDNDKVTALCQGTPFSIVSLTNTQDEKTTIRIFPLLKKDENGVPIPEQNVERLIVHSSTGDYYLIQQLVFGKIFRSYDSFFSKKALD